LSLNKVLFQNGRRNKTKEELADTGFEPLSAGSSLVLFLRPFWKRTFRDKWHRRFSRAGCPSCHPTNSVKAVKKILTPNHWPGLILSSSTTVLLMEGALILYDSS